MIGMGARTVDRFGKVKKKAQVANFTSVGHAAAALRLVARRSIKRSNKPSPPGKPPHTRRGALKNAIRFQVNKEEASAVIGTDASKLGNAGKAHEAGGPFRGQVYPPRPFMGPALKAIENRLPRYWRASVH